MVPFESFSRIKLAQIPTPIVLLERLSSLFKGTRIWMKRDDLTGLGLGGNKLRKLEYLLSDAQKKQSDCILTAGAAQSNHCRQTAAAASLLGLECHLLLGGYEPAIQGNLLLNQLLNAEIHWQGDRRKGEGLVMLHSELKEMGRRPYAIPYGGSNPVGALGFVKGFMEAAQQQEKMGIQFDAIVFASSSGGTHAGLNIGKQLATSSTKVIGIAIDKNPGEASVKEKVEALVLETMDFMQLKTSPAPVEMIEDYMERPYGECGDLETQAIRLIAQKEGVFLDPVYTGRAMGGFLDMMGKGFFQGMNNILFWHTGGAPALFAYADFLKTKTNLE